nr:MM0924 family protein [Methanosarcina siciliae]
MKAQHHENQFHFLNTFKWNKKCGPDIFKGTVEACADNVLTLQKDGKLTHIAIDKIIALWQV